MSKFFLPGFVIGTLTPLYISDRNFLTLWNGLYRPHKEHRERLRERIDKNRGYMNENDYIYYLGDVFISLYEMVYSSIYGNKQQFLLTRQVASLELTTKFEFLNETFNNYEFIHTNIHRILKKNEEKELARLKESNIQPEDMNLKNIQRMKEITKDEYQRFALDNSVMTMENKIKSETVFDKYQSDFKNIQLAIQYDKNIKEFEFYKKNDNFVFGDFRGAKINKISREDLYKPKVVQRYDDIQKEKLTEQLRDLRDILEENKK
jgi:hypothetical protein